MKSKKYNFEQVAEQLVKLRKLKNTSVEVFVVTNAEMDAIKERLMELPQFRGVEADKIKGEKQVSVLAFPEDSSFPAPRSKNKSLGEIYLNHDFAKGDREKLTALLIHGFLHLLGYRHRKKSDRIRMEAEGKKLLGRIVR